MKAILTFSTVMALLSWSVSHAEQPLKNPSAADSWAIDPAEAKQDYTVSVEGTGGPDGHQALLVTAANSTHLTLRQEIFLPVGTLWRLTGWVKSAASLAPPQDPYVDPVVQPGVRIGVDAQVGNQGYGETAANDGRWRQQSVLFRVPSPGRIGIALHPFGDQSGKVWFSDIKLEHVAEAVGTEPAMISATRLSKRPIDLKQGGQFIEPLDNLMSSMIAQQVDSTSFEEETPWTYAFKREIDKPYRPWYPDGGVHVATYSFDTNNPFNGKRSQKIELPVANTWAGISQDGFYLDAGRAYRLRLHLRSQGAVKVRASLHADGGVIAGPVSLGNGLVDWRAAEALLTVKRSARNATLTIEFEGPGTLWLDRVYLIDKAAILGLWRPDVVTALKAMNPGVVRLGGSTIEPFEWEDTLGNWDSRAPFADDPWGGLQENFVGVEEFVQLVQYIGAAAVVCIRWTGKTPQDAANEVEYFNGAPDTVWGKKRAANGHPAPYHVRYWEVGNEVGGAAYDASLKSFAETMKKVDPSIQVLTSYDSINTVRLAGSAIDYLNPHQYTVGDLNGTEAELKQLAAEIAADGKGRDIRVAVTEWNGTAGDWGLKRGMLMTMGNALTTARYQNMMHRYADLIAFANRSNLSDSFGSGVLEPGPGWLYFTPTYYSQILYQRAAGSFPLQITRDDALDGYLREPDLDASVTADGKTLRLYAVNSTPERRKVSFHLDPALGSVVAGNAFILGAGESNADSEAMNSRDQPNKVGVKTAIPSVKGSIFDYTFTPFTVSLLELTLRKAH